MKMSEDENNISAHGVSTRRPKSLSLSQRSPVFSASSAVDLSEPEKKSVRTLPFRVGHGFDLHRVEPGYPLIIGGIDIPHDRGCEAHSDGETHGRGRVRDRKPRRDIDRR